MNIVKKIKLLSLVAASIAVASSANAVSTSPLAFGWDQTDYSATGALALASFNSTSGSTGLLAVGETISGLDFGSISVVGLGAGELTIGVNFIDPTNTNQSVAGNYTVFSAFIFSGGTWQGGSTVFDYATSEYTGTALLELDAIDTGLQFGPKFKFTGSITHLSQAPVPEPATFALMGLGLVGLGFVRRRKA